MKIKRLNIIKLYNQFSYDINFLEDNHLLSILTGPNGYGKTTVLQIIDNISKGNFLYFYTIPFESIEFYFTENISLKIYVEENKKDTDSDEEITIKKIKFIYEDKNQNIINSLELDLEDIYKLISPAYRRSANVYSIQDLTIPRLIQFIESNPELRIYDDIAKSQNQEQFLFFVAGFKSFFIPAQRLYFINDQEEKRYYRTIQYEKKTSIDEVVFSIQQQLQNAKFNYLKNAQDHDNLFINKYLSSTKEAYTEEEYETESEKLQLLIDELFSYRLINKIELLKFDINHKKILTVYLDDLKEKLEYYVLLLRKLRVFSSVLTEKKFTNKTVSFSPEHGILVKLSDGSNIDVNSLSSGEKNEIIMLYHLIFDVKDNTVLLIDEPEISLHVAWQLEFLNDVEKIIEDKKLQVIIATHSPQIINEKWDLCFDFYEHRK